MNQIQQLNISIPNELPVAAREYLAKTFKLSKSEQTVAFRFCCGDQVKQISKDIEKSENTIKSQMKSVYRKTGVNSALHFTSLCWSVAMQLRDAEQA